MDQCEPGRYWAVEMCVSSVIDQCLSRVCREKELVSVCGVVIERRNHQIGRCWKRLGGLMTGWMSGNRVWRVELGCHPGSLTGTAR